MTISLASGGRSVLSLLIAITLGACAPGAVSPPAQVPLEAPADRWAAYRRAEALGQTVLRVDPGRSLIVITVRRGGTLARLGHDHVVASHTVEGLVAPESGQADLSFRLDQLIVDEPNLRVQAGLDTQPSSDAIDGTRSNMLSKVLDAGQFPDVFIHAIRTGTGAGTANVLGVALTLHGVTRKMNIPVDIENTAGPAGPAFMTVSGSFSIMQSDFGIVPFSVMKGAIAVRDQLDLRFRIVAAPGAGISAR
jgi:hypothetical protein